MLFNSGLADFVRGGNRSGCYPHGSALTHTGGLQISPIGISPLTCGRLWHTGSGLGLQFDAVYSGYLGSFEQVSIVRDFIGTFRSEGTLVLVDPAMADGGKLYKTFDPPFVEEMKSLCMHADLIVPNITEAAMLTGETYREGPYDKAYIERLLHGLLLLGGETGGAYGRMV